jgi:diketogulonate reductase-like aldo/keto reductase
MRINTLLVFFLSVLVEPSPVQAGIWNSIFSGKGDDAVPSIKLSNGQKIPLLGLEIGHVKASDVEAFVTEAFEGENSFRLFDTSHVSRNERELAKGIVAGAKQVKEATKQAGPVEVHVVTKVWYTHLGYERTRLSVRESLRELEEALQDPDVDLKVHLMLHWPRCYAGVEWMDCEGEEYYLPDAVKEAGPPPALDKQNAWKESWKALEDIYEAKDSYPGVVSIGVANFKNGDMKAIMSESRILPHLVQLNVWSLLHDPTTVNLCNRHNTHMQVFDVMNGIISRARQAPHASGHLHKVAHELASEERSLTAAQVVFKWLTQYEISALQRDIDLSVAGIPDLTENQLKEVGHAVEAILSGSDMEDDVHVQVTFHAQDQDMVLFFYPGPTDEDELMITYIKKGSSYQEPTHPKHQFRLYSAVDPEVYYDHVVDGKYGDFQHVHVALQQQQE